MALSKDDIRLAAERLDQAEKTRKQIRQISLDHPGIIARGDHGVGGFRRHLVRRRRIGTGVNRRRA